MKYIKRIIFFLRIFLAKERTLRGLRMGWIEVDKGGNPTIVYNDESIRIARKHFLNTCLIISKAIY